MRYVPADTYPSFGLRIVTGWPITLKPTNTLSKYSGMVSITIESFN